MSYLYRPCVFEMDSEAYTKFLILNQEELNLPYSFAMKLSFFSSPLVMGKALLVFNDEPYKIVGAAGFVYGTGANNYEDRHVCQIEVAFILKEYRSTFLFIHGLQTLLSLMKEGNPDVDRVQFWVSSEETYLVKLLSRFAAMSGSSIASGNGGGQNLSFYSLSFTELEQYCERYAITTA